VDPRRSDGGGFGEFYRIDYPTDRFVYDPEVVVDRAAGRLGEASYNPLTNNCEHFVRWCKTGSAECGQVRKLKDRMRSVVKCAAGKLTQEGFEKAGDFGRLSGSTCNFTGGALAFNVVFNLAIEAAIFTKEAVDAYRKYRSGAISRDDFRQHLCKVGCECAGGLVGATALGIVGQLVIPVPFLGGVIGCTLGNLIGRFLGAAIGKKLFKVTH
jgi:phage tail tape-measure protein